jgi:hypothetical protein
MKKSTTILTSFRALAALAFLSDGHKGILECSVKEMNSANESLESTGRMCQLSQTFMNLTEPDTEDLGCSPEDSPVNPSHVPESERVRMIPASCGLRCAESYGKLKPNGYWQKMFLDCLVRRRLGVRACAH